MRPTWSCSTMRTISKRPPRVRPGALGFFLLAAVSLAGCSPKLPDGVDAKRLTETVGAVIGDPATCVILAEKGTGKVLWRSSRRSICAQERQACTRPGVTSPEALIKDAAKGVTLQTGCESVSWAAGPTPRAEVVYAAVMYGERALPGREIAYRLDSAFKTAGF